MDLEIVCPDGGIKWITARGEPIREEAAVKADVTDPAQVKALVDHAVETHGRIDVLVNNAGLMPHSPLELERGKIEDWDRMIDVNMVKFQQRYQMRNRILAKAVPALEFRSFCNSQKCVPSYSGRCNSLRY